MRMKWKPFSSGTPYTCKDCPAYRSLSDELDAWKKLWSMATTAEDGWRRIAQTILDEWVPKEAKDAYVDQLMSRDPNFAKVITGE